MLLEDIVTDLGHDPIGPMMRLQPALTAAETGDFDFAILDINLAGQQSFPVADCLRRRGIPFIFASGYGGAVVPGLSFHATLASRRATWSGPAGTIPVGFSALIE